LIGLLYFSFRNGSFTLPTWHCRNNSNIYCRSSKKGIEANRPRPGRQGILQWTNGPSFRIENPPAVRVFSLFSRKKIVGWKPPSTGLAFFSFLFDRKCLPSFTADFNVEPTTGVVGQSALFTDTLPGFSH
jgi:hypothetical protein